MTRSRRVGWGQYVLAAPFTAVVAIAVWPPSQALRDEVACDRARASSQTQALSCDDAGGSTSEAAMFAVTNDEPGGPECTSRHGDCGCRVPVGSGAYYYVRNQTEWFGHGP